MVAAVLETPFDWREARPEIGGFHASQVRGLVAYVQGFGPKTTRHVQSRVSSPGRRRRPLANTASKAERLEHYDAYSTT